MASVNGHFSSAGDMKSHLQSLLDSKEQQLQQAATFGQRVLAQRMELEDRIRQLQEVEADKTGDEDVEPEAVQKYQELTDTMMGWDTENALLSSAFNSSAMERSSIPVSDLPRDEPERSRTSTNTSTAQSRRAKNAAHRADDVEFAFEIGSGLLNEVRRLQSLLGERDKAIQDMKEEKDDLDGTLESLRTALKQQEASADKYKEENWNLEVSLQDLRTQHADTQSTVQRLDSEQKRLTKLLAASHDASEQYKNENAQLQSIIEDLTAKHETDVALARKHAAALARDKSDLQQAIDRLKAEKERAGRKFGRFGSPATPNTTEGLQDEEYLTPAGYGDDVFSNAGSTNRRIKADTSLLFGDETDGELSPDQSPMSRSPFFAANHPVNEIEVLKQRLAHAHRQVATLKGGLMRERMGKGRGMLVEDDDEEGFEDVANANEGNVRPGASSTRPRGRGRGRGRIRGRGPTLTERLMAADSPSSVSEFDDDASPTRGASIPPIHFQGADEDDMEDVAIELDDDDDIFKADLEPSAESPSKRSSVASVDGMDPVFANILRRTPSTSSIPPNTSPLHQSLLRRSTRGGAVGRRSRGGVFQEGRPPSLVGQPEDLAFALSGTSPNSGSIDEFVQVETAEIACQTESEEEKTLEAIPVPVKEIAHMGVQSEPEVRPAVIPMSNISIQTDVEDRVSKPALRDAGMSTDPSPLMVPAESQTPCVSTKEIDVQVSPVPTADSLVRRTTITQRDSLASGSRSRLASNATITASKTSPRPFVGSSYAEESDADTETGTETETDMDDYQDARQSIMLGSTPSQSRDEFHSIRMSSMHSESRDDFHSVMTMTDNEYEDEDEDDTDTESIKASRVGRTMPSPTPAFVSSPVSYDSKSIEAILRDEPPASPPKPELKEMSIQTDEWKPQPPTPAVPIAPLLYRVGSTTQQFQFIPPPSTQIVPNSNGPSTIPPVVPTPTSQIFRDANIRHQRSSTDSRRQSIESALSSIFDDGPTPKATNSLALVDKSRPPMMALPPPPRAPPPPGSMPPPNFIPERRMPISTGSYDIPPPRPSSPPPPELIQRATTPTFGSVLSISRTTYGPRPHGSSMPPMQQGLRPLPSTSSFRSAANAAALYVPHNRTGREMSTTSLVTDRSPRSSMSSDQNPFRNPTTPQNRATELPGRGEGHPTDPAIIHSITQTMIGEFLYKYTRKTIGKGYGERRHRRFFWVHPYTKTLYWSSADPGSSNVSESSAKSAYIEGVRSVLDPNPMPPGLYQYSVVVSTPQREMKITAPTKERHDIWLNALKYLLSRPNAVNVNSPGNTTTVPDSPMSLGDFADDDRRPIMSSPQSQRSGRSTRRAADVFNTTPKGKRSRSQISVGGSIGKRSGTPAAEYLRWNGPESPYSPTKSFVDVHGDGDDLDFELHGESDDENGFEGLENVRACCDGRHTVGHSGRHPHHHHHNGNGLDPNSAGPSEQARPVSPSAWSFRSSTNSHESGGAALFSWSRSDGKLRFGSRRSTKTSVT
ncbi:uncharacterized protein BT62DRAFT_945930 [Guyanagaster necrorhizus]|uniref:PH domain-containing protein n=1 Tax=Guyanagaster necrorhizus TaxID=856835 RepID=A0A9P8AUV6_9AGAR|nr:uncharacterized protein BT62DRAFT_945930 [Guyanagaster necrorhizus MCA 3950]KAG7448461.1 hypothetical protein BT62DRAFT_945930 [Guyanagaster necrorhizus MCA 3950]